MLIAPSLVKYRVNEGYKTFMGVVVSEYEEISDIRLFSNSRALWRLGSGSDFIAI